MSFFRSYDKCAFFHCLASVVECTRGCARGPCFDPFFESIHSTQAAKYNFPLSYFLCWVDGLGMPRVKKGPLSLRLTADDVDLGELPRRILPWAAFSFFVSMLVQA